MIAKFGDWKEKGKVPHAPLDEIPQEVFDASDREFDLRKVSKRNREFLIINAGSIGYCETCDDDEVDGYVEIGLRWYEVHDSGEVEYDWDVIDDCSICRECLDPITPDEW